MKFDLNEQWFQTRGCLNVVNEGPFQIFSFGLSEHCFL